MVPLALRSRHSTRRPALVFALLTVLMAGSCHALGAAGRATPPDSGEAGRGGSKPAIAAGYQLDGSLLGRTGAYLSVGDPASRVQVRMARLPGLLYRITTPV